MRMTDIPPVSRRAVLKHGAVALALATGGRALGRARAQQRHPLLTTDFESPSRYADPDERLDDFEDVDAWSEDEGSLSADTNEVYRGSQSARLSTPANSDADALAISREFDELDLSDRDLSLALRLGDPDTEQLVVEVEDDEGDYVEMNRRTISPTYGWFRIDLGVTDETGDPDLSSVEEIRIRFNRDSDDPMLVWLDDLGTTPRVDGGRVVLTFDDGGITQYTRALPVLESFGFPAVTCVNTGRADRDDYLGESEMREMRAAGWEIGSHTVDHRDLPELSNDEARRQVADAKQWLLDRGFEVGSAIFTYPWSGTSPRIRSIVSDHHYLAFTDGSMPHGARLTGPLTVGRVFGENRDRVETTLDLAEKYGQTVVLAYHQVGAGGWISESAFRETMNGIAERGLDVIKPSTLLTELLDPPVTEIEPLSVPRVVARDGDIELADVQRAVHWNEQDAYVPRTNGEKMDDETLAEILEMWENGR
ncbi:polysaccharide deacetylase family protein [Haloarcula pellucida]|uniref:NodB homology domain-containing protein n=1 Tax=Haloarcula pellucida TaxID=1427151 RepID=A0A830GP13_9EURY|nr:polysaccharide deacetylase family protein [Halomicroarcula pellucida]MBX0348191.1 polysaccharide deacetylase family protein [Halomicroarcula pellucida]GGN97400.1 hypothetical protein GCM10009030_26620 [Halomicroarcula pellucida]